MRPEYDFFPPQASTFAVGVDNLYFFFLIVCGFFGLLVFFVAALFAVRYRRSANRYDPNHKQPLLAEVAWSLPPALVVGVLFVWGAQLYVSAYTPPPGAYEIFVTGKQWMWKIQHGAGKKEINELHVPIGRKIKLTMTSEDVIHSFYIPAFRLKRDVLPGRYTTMWFEATEVGEYHLFCTEFCGKDHSRMIGKVVVMTQSDYEIWLEGGDRIVSLPDRGKKIFEQRACVTCHHEGSGARGPDLAGIFGTERPLANGTKVLADPTYLRESILNPRAKLVAGYQPVMPTFQGQLDEESVTALIAYIKSLKKAPTSAVRTEETR